MRIRPRDITIGLLLAITIALTFYFYENLGIAKKSACIDLLTILPSEPKSILTLTKPIKNQKFSWNDSGIQKIFNNNIPQKWTEILRLQNGIGVCPTFLSSGRKPAVRTYRHKPDRQASKNWIVRVSSRERESQQLHALLFPGHGGTIHGLLPTRRPVCGQLQQENADTGTWSPNQQNQSGQLGYPSLKIYYG